MSSKLRNFLFHEGRLKHWPSKRVTQVEDISYIASKFPEGSSFSRIDIIEIISQTHTLGDWTIIRIEMCGLGFFNRDRNGAVYTGLEKI